MKKKISVLIITGPVGVGKSVVADEVFETLRKTPTAVALVNFDELTYARPLTNDPYGTKLGLKNLRSIWINYTEVGIRNLIIPYVVESPEDIDLFNECIPDSDIFVVRLTANIDTLHKRLSNRMMGGSLEWHLNRANELTGIYFKNPIGNIIIDTNNKSIDDVAKEIITKWICVT